MKRWMLAAALFGALVVTAPSAWSQVNLLGLEQAPPEQVGVSKEKLGRIHDALQESIADGKLAGTVVLVARKGKLIYADAAGFQDKDEGKSMALDSIFRIYSMTKPLVSVAAMMLVEDGKIELTDPVSKFFPAFKGQQVSVARPDGEFARMTYTTVPADREIIVQDLLRHTAGLAYGEITLNAPVKDAYTKAGLYLPGVRDYDARDLTPAEEVERLAKAPLAHQPGTVWEYSLAVDLLGRVVEAASGKRLADFLAQRLFEPLKMQDTGFWVPGAKMGRRRSAACGRFRQRPADQSHRCLERAEERFRRRGRGIHRGRLSALRADAAQRRTTRWHAGAVAHDRRADDIGSFGHADRGAGHAERASARHARLHASGLALRCARAPASPAFQARPESSCGPAMRGPIFGSTRRRNLSPCT